MIHYHFIFCRQRYKINSEHSYTRHVKMCGREFSDADDAEASQARDLFQAQARGLCDDFRRYA